METNYTHQQWVRFATSLIAITATITHAQTYNWTTLAGLAGSSGTADGTSSTARFNWPVGIFVDRATNVFVVDKYSCTIRKVTPSGVVTTLAGRANYTGSADGAGSAARFNGPIGVTVDSAGNLYVADCQNNTIRKVTPQGTNWIVSTLAGLAGYTGTADGTGSSARFYYPSGVAVDSAGNVYVADSQNNTIRKITSGGVVTTLAGGGGGSSGGSVDGVGAAARFLYPYALALDSSGNLFVADSLNNGIRKVTPAGVVTTVAGLLGISNSGSTDGTDTAARFYYPRGIAVQNTNTLYVGDYRNNTIRKVTQVGASWVVTTIGGLAGSSGATDGTGSSARFYQLEGVAVDILGRVYVADAGNKTIRLGTPQIGSLHVTLQPTAAVTAGAKWNVDGGSWQNSASVASDLAVGSHVVAFSTISGWTTPSSQTVAIYAAQTTSTNAMYVAVNTPPTCSITNIAAGASFTGPTNLTIAASASDSAGSIGSVQFMVGNNLAGTATVSPYKVTTNNLPVGSYSLTAVATDNLGAKGTSAPVSITITAAVPMVFITIPASNSVYATPANLIVQATATNAAGASVTNVEFLNGATVLGSDSTSPYSFATNNLPAGIYSFIARARNNSGGIASSAPVPITVVQPATLVIATNRLRSANGVMPVTITTTPGLRYAFDRSGPAFPSNWIPFVTNTAVSNSLTLSNSMTGLSNCFFRARLLPNQ